MVAVADIAYVVYDHPDLDEAERFYRDFGLVTAARRPDELLMRGADGQPIRDAQTGGVDEKDAVFSQRVPVFMNRPGRFSVRVSALDKVTNKRASFDLPVRIDPAQ